MAILSDNPQYDFEKEGRTAERAKNISFDEFLARDENIFERGADRLVERLLDRAFDEERYDFVDRYVADLCGGGRRAEPAILSTGNARLLSYTIDESVFRVDAKLPEARFHTAAVEINDAATSVVLGAASVLESWKDEAEKKLENERSEKERICSEQEQEQDDGIPVL